MSADLLTLQLLGVSHIGEKLADAVELRAKRVDIVAKIRRVIIMGLIFHGLDDVSNLVHASMKALELGVDLALDDLQIRDHDANPHH